MTPTKEQLAECGIYMQLPTFSISNAEKIDAAGLNAALRTMVKERLNERLAQVRREREEQAQTAKNMRITLARWKISCGQYAGPQWALTEAKIRSAQNNRPHRDL